MVVGVVDAVSGYAWVVMGSPAFRHEGCGTRCVSFSTLHPTARCVQSRHCWMPRPPGRPPEEARAMGVPGQGANATS